MKPLQALYTEDNAWSYVAFEICILRVMSIAVSGLLCALVRRCVCVYVCVCVRVCVCVCVSVCVCVRVCV